MHLCKSGFSNEIKDKINCRSQNLQIVASSRINSISKINFTFKSSKHHKITFWPSRVEIKHMLNICLSKYIIFHMNHLYYEFILSI